MSEVAGQRQDDDKAPAVRRFSHTPAVVAAGFVCLALVSMAVAVALTLAL